MNVLDTHVIEFANFDAFSLPLILWNSKESQKLNDTQPFSTFISTPTLIPS
jgi:hypothetical protein